MGSGLPSLFFRVEKDERIAGSDFHVGTDARGCLALLAIAPIGNLPFDKYPHALLAARPEHGDETGLIGGDVVPPDVLPPFAGVLVLPTRRCGDAKARDLDATLTGDELHIPIDTAQDRHLIEVQPPHPLRAQDQKQSDRLGKLIGELSSATIVSPVPNAGEGRALR